MDCDESPRSGSFWPGESGTEGTPIDPYFWISPESGSVGAGAGTGGIEPYLRRSPGSAGVWAAAVEISGGGEMGATAIANATSVAVHARALRHERCRTGRLAGRTGSNFEKKLGVMGWC